MQPVGHWPKGGPSIACPWCVGLELAQRVGGTRQSVSPGNLELETQKPGRLLALRDPWLPFLQPALFLSRPSGDPEALPLAGWGDPLGTTGAEEAGGPGRSRGAASRHVPSSGCVCLHFFN